MSLQLPEHWATAHAGATVAALLRQLDYWTNAKIAAGYFLSASMQLWHDTHPAKSGPWHAINGGKWWRFGRLRYFLAWPLDDLLIWEATESPSARGTIVITPPNHAGHLREALATKDMTARCIDEFISWRAFCASIDGRMTYRETVRSLLLRYQKFIADHPNSATLQIRAVPE